MIEFEDLTIDEIAEIGYQRQLEEERQRKAEEKAAKKADEERRAGLLAKVRELLPKALHNLLEWDQWIDSNQAAIRIAAAGYAPVRVNVFVDWEYRVSLGNSVHGGYRTCAYVVHEWIAEWGEDDVVVYPYPKHYTNDLADALRWARDIGDTHEKAQRKAWEMRKSRDDEVDAMPSKPETEPALDRHAIVEEVFSIAMKAPSTIDRSLLGIYAMLSNIFEHGLPERGD